MILKAALDSNGFTDREIDLDPYDSPQTNHSDSSTNLELNHGNSSRSQHSNQRQSISTVRGIDMGPREQPLRVIVDPNCKVKGDYKVLSDERRNSPHSYLRTDLDDDSELVERIVLSDSEGEIPISRILDMLGDRGIQTLLVEGGPDTWNRFVESGLVDMAHICRSQIELEGARLPFDENRLHECGLKKTRTFDSGGDLITHWEK